jgi:hypothetical protein
MEQSPSRVNASYAATKHFTHILWNKKCSLSCSQKPFTCLCPHPDQSSPFHPKLSVRDPRVRLDLPNALFPSGSPVISIPLLPHACYMPRPYHHFILHHSNNSWLRVKIMKLFIMYMSPTYCHCIHLQSKSLLSTHFAKTLSLCSSLKVRDQVYTNTEP